MSVVDREPAGCFAHDAFVYGSDDEYVATLAPLLADAVAAGDAVIAVVLGPSWHPGRPPDGTRVEVELAPEGRFPLRSAPGAGDGGGRPTRPGRSGGRGRSPAQGP